MKNQDFQQALIAWYKENARVLAFRQEKLPYKIWISEIMAQQTRIEAMLPYFERFIQELPSIEALANVDDEKLHKLWQGLGYYNRCRNLKKCAQVCMETYNGQLPQTYEQLLSLPGIGPYTAGAIASIAFDQRVSAIDGNVIRVFSRLYDIHDDTRKSTTLKAIAKKVDASLPLAHQISDYNQALMELGALICIPKHPRCDTCPISFQCKAYRQGTQDVLPIKSKAKERRIEHKDVYVWVHDQSIHIQKREAKGLLHGLYEFDDALPNQYYKVEKLESYTHIFSHVEWHMNAYLVYTNQADISYTPIQDIESDYAIPTAFQPFYKQVKERIL